MAALLVSGLLAASSPAQEVAAAESAPVVAQAGNPGPVVDLDAVVVSGVQPGPGLWRVSKGDHVLYILGTQSPLPRDITWRADEVRQVLGEAGAVLGSPGVTIGADIGFFRGLTLMPSALKAMKNPDGATLDEVLPADLYQRWNVLRQRYLGRDRSVEKKRPLIAVYELYRAALEHNGLRQGGVVGPVIDQVLKPRGLKRTPTVLDLKIDDPRAALADLRKEGLGVRDLECFSGTLDVIEHDLPRIAARANAWATGDLEALRNMPGVQDQVDTCLSAWTATDVARKNGLVDVEPRIRATWLAAADKALQEQAVSFALLPIDSLLDDGAYLAQLRQRGYRVVAPDADDGQDETGGENPVDEKAGVATRPASP
ncbi:MAG: TraB/GumN family protein [Pseudoxanthomonas sp.]|nr:TraB/GumN family protein [Pseudoxanthomonas sp.]